MGKHVQKVVIGDWKYSNLMDNKSPDR